MLATREEMTFLGASLAVLSKVSVILSWYKDLRPKTSETNFTPTKGFVILCFLPSLSLLIIFYRH